MKYGERNKPRWILNILALALEDGKGIYILFSNLLLIAR